MFSRYAPQPRASESGEYRRLADVGVTMAGEVRGQALQANVLQHAVGAVGRGGEDRVAQVLLERVVLEVAIGSGVVPVGRGGKRESGWCWGGGVRRCLADMY